MKQLRKGFVILLAFLCLTLSACRLELPLPTLQEINLLPEVATESLETEPITQPPTTQPPTTEPPQTQPRETEPPETEPTEPPPLEVELPEPENSDFVRVRDYIPDIIVELRYATEDNFTGQTIYTFDELWLRYGTVKKLIKVQDALRDHGMGLKVWDGFRPVAAQFALWEVYPNPTYVANPNGGYSSHSRGNTIDLTVVDAEGNELTMPTGFDDFSKKANRNYSDVSKEAANNSKMLEGLMIDCGFTSIQSEWWHFVDSKSYSPEKTFQPVGNLPYVGIDGDVEFFSSQDDTQELLCMIPAEEVFSVIALDGEYLLTEYRGVLGYVQTNQVVPVELAGSGE